VDPILDDISGASPNCHWRPRHKSGTKLTPARGGAEQNASHLRNRTWSARWRDGRPAPSTSTPPLSVTHHSPSTWVSTMES